MENDIWKREEDLENTKKVMVKFKRRLSAEIRRQKKSEMTEKRDFRRGELLEKYIAKILYRWDNRNLKE